MEPGHLSCKVSNYHGKPLEDMLVVWEFHVKYISDIQYFSKVLEVYTVSLFRCIICFFQQPALPNRTKEGKNKDNINVKSMTSIK